MRNFNPCSVQFSKGKSQIGPPEQKLPRHFEVFTQQFFALGMEKLLNCKFYPHQRLRYRKNSWSGKYEDNSRQTRTHIAKAHSSVDSLALTNKRLRKRPQLGRGNTNLCL